MVTALLLFLAKSANYTYDAIQNVTFEIKKLNIYVKNTKTSSQAPSYASESETMNDRPTDLLTGVKCRATSVAKKCTISAKLRV